MNKPEELRAITENTLHELTADDSLKFRILQAAADTKQAKPGKALRPVSAVCISMAVLLLSVFALNKINPVSSAGPVNIHSFIAGSMEIVRSDPLPSGFGPDTAVSVSYDDYGIVSEPDQCHILLRILKDKSTITDGKALSADRKLTITAESGKQITFMTCDPFLIGEDGRCWSCPDLFSELADMKK